MLCRYDLGEAEAESEAEADEFEFSDDEKELAWRREQMAQQPAKRKAQEAPRGRGPARGVRHSSSSDHGPGLILVFASFSFSCMRAVPPSTDGMC